MKKILLLVSCLGGLGVSYADCLDNLLPEFKSHTVTVEVKNGKFNLTGINNKKVCKVTSQQLEKFINKNFIRLNENKSVVTSWNYLAVNKQPIYDALKELKSPDSDGLTTTPDYTLYGVLNSTFACYRNHYDYYMDTAAYPNAGVSYICQDAKGKSLKITDVVATKDIINWVTKNPDIKRVLKANGVNPSNVKSFSQLYTVLAKDEDMSCAVGSEVATNFAITKVNTDGTINLIYSIGQNAPHVCQGASPDDIVIKNVKPLIDIVSFVTPDDLMPVK